jgi:hypothetical protein
MMGEVKEAVKGSSGRRAKDTSRLTHGNLIDSVRSLREEVGELTNIKDEETLKEGDLEKADNMRKAALLRATYSLLSAAETILEDY